jgi:hypothetical protein
MYTSILTYFPDVPFLDSGGTLYIVSGYPQHIPRSATGNPLFTHKSSVLGIASLFRMEVLQ